MVSLCICDFTVGSIVLVREDDLIAPRMAKTQWNCFAILSAIGLLWLFYWLLCTILCENIPCGCMLQLSHSGDF